ncbi:MAG: thiamine pyrophosphate-requiring protein, partial [Oscillospiraceae bacterium]|nr:thiamine pyrophosphate-requiring protein [Oscillospiraceae bacterium]
MPDNNELYTAADALNDALLASGVTHAFVNVGTDYPPLIESWAKHKANGDDMINIITSPHEYAAISAAQGFAQVSGRAQAVFVHVDVGTQNLGGGLHNAFRCRVPMFILAGLSPFTMEGEMKGSRDAYIQYIQNVGDQHGIVRNYTKMCTELRTGVNVQQGVYRAMQIAESEPKGPVYMTAAREPLEEPGRVIDREKYGFKPVSPTGLGCESLEAVVSALVGAKRPLVITSYLGRVKEAVGELKKLCDALAIPVIESNQVYINYPMDDVMYIGDDFSLVEKADVILSIDCDIPWPSSISPSDDCRVFSLDVDPVKEYIPLWHINAERFMKCDACTSLRQINNVLTSMILDTEAIEQRRACVTEMHNARLAAIYEEEKVTDTITPEYITACVRSFLTDDDIVLNEAISYGAQVNRHIMRNIPGSLMSSGGSSLGWFGGAAVGAKLAAPDKRIVALASDGTFIFSCPTAVYWMSRRYNAPFLTV